jgi:hypothetical protein
MLRIRDKGLILKKISMVLGLVCHMNSRNGSFPVGICVLKLVLQKMHSGIAWLTLATYNLEVYFTKFDKVPQVHKQ